MAAAVALAGWTPQSKNEGSANGLNYRSATQTFAGSGGATAACKGMRKVTGGGAELDGSVAEGTIHHLDANDSDEVSPKRGWTGEGLAVPNGQDLEVTAICAKPKGIVQNSEIDTPSGAGAPFGTTAECPAGTRVTGGGFHGNDSDDDVLLSAPVDTAADTDTKPDDGWSAEVIADSIGDTVTVTVVCSKRLKLKYVQTDLTAPSGVQETAVCPDSRSVTGGGHSLPGGAGATIHSSNPADVGDGDDVPSDGWHAQARVDSGSRTLLVYAVCAKKP